MFGTIGADQPAVRRILFLSLVRLLGLLLVGAPSAASAGVNGRTRLHQADKLMSRLSPQAQRNTRATGEYWSPDAAGSAVLVQRSADGKHGLVLTNFHVAPKLPAQSAIKFGGKFGGSTAHATALISQREDLDYALLHVAFEEGTAPDPVRLSTRAPGAGERLYNVGFPGISALYLQLDDGPTAGPFTNFDRSGIDRELDALPGRVRTINVGHERGGGEVRRVTDSDPRIAQRVHVQRHSFTTDLQTLPGASGSPVFSAGDHRMVGLVWSGGRSHPGSDVHWDDAVWAWSEGGLAVPAALVLADLRLKLPSLGAHAGAVRELFDRAF